MRCRPRCCWLLCRSCAIPTGLSEGHSRCCWRKSPLAQELLGISWSAIAVGGRLFDMVRRRRCDMAERLQPITRLDEDEATWSGATWVGQVSEVELEGRRLELVDGRPFHRARLLVWT